MHLPFLGFRARLGQFVKYYDNQDKSITMQPGSVGRVGPGKFGGGRERGGA